MCDNVRLLFFFFFLTQDTDGRPPSDNRQILPITKRRPDPRPHRYEPMPQPRPPPAVPTPAIPLYSILP